MAEANQAYEDANEERLRAILGWETSSKSVKGEGVVTELIGTIHQNCPKPEALRTIQGRNSGFGTNRPLPAKTKVITAQQAGQDLLEMASQLTSKLLPKERLEN